MNRSTAGRLTIIKDLYDAGALCDCVNYIVTRDDWDEVEKTTLVHEDECSGRQDLRKLMELA